MYSFMLIFDVGTTFGLYLPLLDSWDEVVAVCVKNPPVGIPEFNAYCIFRCRKGEEYRLSDLWKRLSANGDLERACVSDAGVSSLICNFVPRLDAGFGQGNSDFYGLQRQSTPGTAPLSSILERFVGGLENKRMETQEAEGPQYTPTEAEKARWEAYRGAVEHGLYGEYPDDVRSGVTELLADTADAEKESA